jgi:uncharacterized pyridoxamine 5'-phosphate oxidase family protein
METNAPIIPGRSFGPQATRAPSSPETAATTVWWGKNKEEVGVMHEVVDFLKDNSNGFLATTDNGKPKVRPFQFMYEEGGKLYFCTNNTKEVFRQLKANPFVQFSSSNAKYQWIRLSGQVRFTGDSAAKARVLEASELVKSVYKTPDNPIFEVFYLEHGSAVLADFSGKPPREVEF